MQPEDSSLVRGSFFSIYDLLPILTFLILGSVIVQIKSEPLDTFAAARAIMVAIAGIYLLYRMFTRKTDFSFAAVQWADGAEQIEIIERTAGPLLECRGYAMNSTREENFVFASPPQAVGQQ
jgi:hypothetical protein